MLLFESYLIKRRNCLKSGFHRASFLMFVNICRLYFFDIFSMLDCCELICYGARMVSYKFTFTIFATFSISKILWHDSLSAFLISTLSTFKSAEEPIKFKEFEDRILLMLSSTLLQGIGKLNTTFYLLNRLKLLKLRWLRAALRWYYSLLIFFINPMSDCSSSWVYV